MRTQGNARPPFPLSVFETLTLCGTGGHLRPTFRLSFMFYEQFMTDFETVFLFLSSSES